MNPVTWLFTTRAGVLTLVAAGIVIFLIVAFVAEQRMRQQYFNHEKDPDDDSILGALFDDED